MTDEEKSRQNEPKDNILNENKRRSWYEGSIEEAAANARIRRRRRPYTPGRRG